MKKDFKNILKYPQPGDIILFSNSRNIMSKTFKYFGDFTPKDNKETWSHIAMYIGSGYNLIYEYTFKHGCRLVPLTQYFKDEITMCIKRKKGITITEVSQLKDVIYKEVENDKPYDWKSLLGIFFAYIFKLNRAKNNKFSGKMPIYQPKRLSIKPDWHLVCLYLSIQF